MPVDPTDPETFDDAYEEEAEREALDDPETPEADAAEQQADVVRRQDTPLTGRASDEVNTADALEQSRVVEENEDDYR